MAASGAGATTELSLLDRIVAIVSMRGNVGITQDELLGKLGVARGELKAVLDQLREAHLIRVHGPSAESFRVFDTG